MKPTAFYSLDGRVKTVDLDNVIQGTNYLLGLRGWFGPQHDVELYQLLPKQPYASMPMTFNWALGIRPGYLPHLAPLFTTFGWAVYQLTELVNQVGGACLPPRGDLLPQLWRPLPRVSKVLPILRAGGGVQGSRNRCLPPHSPVYHPWLGRYTTFWAIGTQVFRHAAR